MNASQISAVYSRLSLPLAAARQLGISPLAQYALYRFGLWTGHYRRSTPVEILPAQDQIDPDGSYPIAIILHLPDSGELAAILGERAGELVGEADEIVAGRVRLYGGPAVPLELALPGSPRSLEHWTETERGKNHWLGGRDIKDIWEPGRFGWAFILARAYRLTQNDAYAQAFWRYTGLFFQANPPNLGPQWASGQEVALRLIALAFASQVFLTAPPTTPNRTAWLASVLAAHARRIPPTLVYARSQDNNHLVTEAAGLFTAGLALSAHPQAASWRELGWKWLNRALQRQIAPDGTYTQHSTNYHRLVLHASLWVNALLVCRGESYPAATLDRLAAATRWLAGRLDPASGRVPNLGSNDGANILPLSTCQFQDHRPVLQSAGQAFCGGSDLPAGPWTEERVWLVPRESRAESRESELVTTFDSRISTPDSWGMLRAARFAGRPSHADQLHVDLWWRGLNIAQDAGTYRYNAPPPWDNSLACTLVHNTIEIDGQDQMRRAGRFLWLDWAQAEVTTRDSAPDGDWQRVTARHDGYRRLGILHERSLEFQREGRWIVTDRLLNMQSSPATGRLHTARLNWLLPDWEWTLDGTSLGLFSPYGVIRIRLQVGDLAGSNGADGLQVQLIRAGVTLVGSKKADPIRGWASPTYGVKLPALAYSVQMVRPLPVVLTTTWALPPSDRRIN